ncbi:SMI1/KNR4 family protein [Streptosporangium sp. G11]|uniref:SMI1/KNR4 family protein n=1 Tax=Streptosporangium sp. G11 TaxID=3436926 RepID=UPI003EC0F96F
MLRLITSRKVRLALAAAALAAAVVAVARLWRRAEERRAALPIGRSRGASPVGRSQGASPAAGPDSGAGRASRWPPAPILGTPTDEDLRRYAARPPSAFRSAVERTFERTSREPLDEATRSRVVRWGAVGIGLCLLAFGTQVLESAVFPNGTGSTQVSDFWSSPGADGWCEPEPDAPVDPVARFTVELDPAPGVNGVACPQGGHRCLGDSCLEPPGARELLEAVGEGPDPAMDPYPAEPVPSYETPAPHEAATAIPDADCHPRARTPRVRALSPRVTRAVNRQWRRIERWLGANAPASLRTLGEPAGARTIAVAEAQMGLRFPDDLRAFLLRHNGASVVADTWPFGFIGNWNQGVREIRDTWRRLCGIDGEVEVEGDDGARTEWWDGRMIPFGADGSGNHLVIDSVRRDVGDTDHEGQMSFTPGGTPISSYYGLLKATAHALETGGSIGYWKPVVADGELDWDVVEE